MGDCLFPLILFLIADENEYIDVLIVPVQKLEVQLEGKSSSSSESEVVSERSEKLVNKGLYVDLKNLFM